jgi:uncharacterized protein (TIGR02271 family)
LAGDRREGDLAANRPANFGTQAHPDGQGRAMFRNEEARVPIVEEQVEIGKREVETGRVRVRTVVDEEKLNLTELLERDIVEIERVPVGREVDQAPLPFEEGDVLVIPVIEERIVVQKRLVVVEEVRIRRRHEQTRTEIPVTRRVMHAEVERSAPPAPQAGPPMGAADPRRPMPAAADPRGPMPAAADPRGPMPTSADPRRPMPAADAAALRDRSPSRSDNPFGGRAQDQRPPVSAGPNWTIIALVVAAVLLLLLVIAGGS